MGTVDWTDETEDRYPAIPFFVPYLVGYWFGRRYRSVWRFNPNSLMGGRRHLLFLHENAEE